MDKSLAVQKIFESSKQIWTAFLEKINLKEKQLLRRQLFDNACKITEQIPCFTLKATLHGEFWKEIEEVI